MGLFNKIDRELKLFSKSVQGPQFFNKLGNGIASADSAVQKVGQFLKPIALVSGQPELLPLIEGGLRGTHAIANGLERLAPIAQRVSNKMQGRR